MNTVCTAFDGKLDILVSSCISTLKYYAEFFLHLIWKIDQHFAILVVNEVICQESEMMTTNFDSTYHLYQVGILFSKHQDVEALFLFLLLVV